MRTNSKKQKLLNLLAGNVSNELSWHTIIDQYSTIEGLPASLQGMTPLEFYRHIGCDTLIFGGLGLKQSGLEYGMPYRVVMPEMSEKSEILGPDKLLLTRECEYGVLSRIEYKGYVMKHEIESYADVRVLERILEQTRVEVDQGNRRREDKIAAAIGEDGVQFHAMEPSPVQNLIEYYIGLERFYYMLMDEPVIIEGLMERLHDLMKKKYIIACQNSDREAIIAVENTSTTLVSPAFYEKYSKRHLQEYTDIVHTAGKKMILHMCGLVYHLLPIFNEMTFDAIHALSPPPCGDTTLDDVSHFINRKLYIIGGMTANTTLFLEKGVDKAALFSELDLFYDERVRSLPFTLALPADGIVTQYDNFMYIAEWFQQKMMR